MARTMIADRNSSSSLGAFQAATRRLESGSFDGRYSVVGPRIRGSRPFGAYQIVEAEWPSMAAAAGITGASIRDPLAQDRVAATAMVRYFQRYGSWDLAAVAWYAGQRYADMLARRGYRTPADIGEPTVRRYVDGIRSYMEDRRAQEARPRGYKLTQRPSEDRWLMPVAGPNKWNPGSFMDKHTKHAGSHHAIDIYAKKGTPIVAPVGGTVVRVGTPKTHKKGGYTVTLKGNDGNMYYMAHMAAKARVSKGARVSAGTHLGYVGNSGSARTTKSHLHFSIHRGNKVIHPKHYLRAAEDSDGVFTGFEDPGLYEIERGSPSSRRETKMGKMLHSFADVYSKQVAGGRRIDPRTLGGGIDPEVSLNLGEGFSEAEGTAESLIGRETTEIELNPGEIADINTEQGF